MENKGLTLTIIFEAESANYGESIGNVASLKKISRGLGEQYTYISRQAIRYNIVNQMGADNTKIGLDGSVLQFDPSAKIDEFAEIDLFGYMKTSKTTKTRSAVVRMSNAISLEPYRGDLDFLTNKGLYDRYIKQTSDKKDGGNIAQSEIHHSLYTYTITVDLERVGFDENDNINIENKIKAERIVRLLNTVKYLYRDIKGRRENLSPLFIIGGVYKIKNPIYQNVIEVKGGKLNVEKIKDAIGRDLEAETISGLLPGVFENEAEIKKELSCKKINEFFEDIEKKVKQYYESYESN
ncbi:devr family CRISPR-associated regulatory protein [Johnsonella ignava ATCC 51276]|uniref:Devr family CRISPR-associated regulatory protein n=1 Tax=Johnsonella ignava ATCC 51276 TaxID=679200 RepID=G5GIK9_9FIRM|nr:type I-B CRISPR-associated protein Cas7/Cst2/DevR [Johnsonella ignava]EHI55263.1 devr family CRISPR-associated regulatory protein [Johnsonella ignava ATCC 51276]